MRSVEVGVGRELLHRVRPVAAASRPVFRSCGVAAMRARTASRARRGLRPMLAGHRRADLHRGREPSLTQPAPSASAARCCRSPTSAAIVDFARGLAELGRRDRLDRRHGARARRGRPRGPRIEDFTGFPEIMDGRVKTLHPKLYAGLLAVRDDPEHLAAAAEHDIEFVDLVCVNLYPFERTAAGAARRGRAEVIENIDIGGPTMIRAAAKNHAFAAWSSRRRSPTTRCSRSCARPTGTLSLPTRESLAAEAFAYTARYDTAIARWFAEKARGLPAAVRARLREGHRPALRREPAPARRLLPAGRRAHARAVEGPAAPRQADLLQQHARPRRRAGARRATSRSRRA